MANLAHVVEFAQTWHRGPWSGAQLADAAGVEVVYADGPAYSLGVAFRLGDRRIIGLNSWLRDRPDLRRLIVPHETSHHLLGTTGYDFCRFDNFQPSGESAAWYGAATLLIPDTRLAQWQREHDSLEELADEFDLPIPCVRLCAEVYGYRRGRASTMSGSLGDALLGLVSWLHGQARLAKYPS